MSISRRSLLKGMAATGAVAATAGCATSPSSLASSEGLATPKKKPNLLIVFPDEMRAHALGFMKQDPSSTPHLNRFAKQSVVLRQAVSNFPLCTPFRGMLMTGQYPYRNGIQAIAILRCLVNSAGKTLVLS